MRALSIRQPWAWAIIAGHKDIENRSWQTSYRGPLLIHAGKQVIADDYEDMLRFGREDNFLVPPLSGMPTGGIIGEVELVDIVMARSKRARQNPWFDGPYGWVLANPKPLPFRPWKGQQGLFTIDG
jgi:hypothetical protein